MSAIFSFRVNDVVLGGTSEPNNWNSAVNTNDSTIIYDRCCRLLPSLKVRKRNKTTLRNEC